MDRESSSVQKSEIQVGMAQDEEAQNEAIKDMMAESHNEPTYNLKAVVQETGLKADTLRAWERRYGLPQPKRTQSGHRLYSKRDIGILKWLLARQSEGLNISRAVALWQRLIEDGIDPIDTSEENGSGFGREAVVPSSPANSGSTAELHSASSSALNATPNSMSTQGVGLLGGQIVDLRREWVLACLHFDEVKAEQVLANAFSLFDTETVCIELLFKGISEIGVGWTEGRVTAQQEHFASSLATRRLHALMNGTPPPTKLGKILIGCPPGEEHTFPSNLLALLLKRQGWNVLVLGANIPVKDLSDTMLVTKPTLVILTAQQLHTASTLLEVGNVLYEAAIPLAYGGSVFMQTPELQHCIPGYYLGDSIGDVPLIVDQLMSAPRVRPAQRNVPAEYADGLAAFRQHRAEVEKQVVESMRLFDVDQQVVSSANHCLNQAVTAALSLCKTSTTGAELEDIRILLLNHHNMSPSLIDAYLDAYHSATLDHCHEADSVVAEWLSTLLGVGDYA